MIENMKEIVERLIGNIEPVGCSVSDTKYYENLEQMTILIEDLVYEVSQVARKNKDRYEASMKDAGQYADKFLNNLAAELKEL